MKMKLIPLFMGFLLISSFFSCVSREKTKNDSKSLLNKEVVINQDFKQKFHTCKVEGSVVIFDNNKRKWFVSDTLSISRENLPASTFKIINLLIALETKTIKDENEIVKWVGKTDTVKYGYRPSIYHDMTVKEAFEVSAGWVFVELAKKIGKDNYKKYLSLCKYGNLNLSQKDDDFWNFGAFEISPVNQVEFLRKFYEEKLPFSKRNIEIVKKVMITEQTENYTLRSKTGWTRDNGINIGWWVGYIENKNGVYFFATRLLQDRKQKSSDFGNCRKEITKSAFKILKIVE